MVETHHASEHDGTTVRHHGAPPLGRRCGQSDTEKTQPRRDQHDARRVQGRAYHGRRQHNGNAWRNNKRKRETPMIWAAWMNSALRMAAISCAR